MNAAIYCRRSREQNVAEDAKSVKRQEENARAFAATKGWTVRDEHIYVDDGVSGAEFERRPGFMRMMAAAEPRSPFGVLVVSEQKSIGREAFETQYVIKRLAKAGVEVFEYVQGRSLTPRNALDKVLSSVQGFADEAYRESSAQRMHEAHTRLASKGFVTGGRLFGYRNRHVFSGVDANGNPQRSHVDREVVSEEAAVILRIFKLYDQGLGLKRIARTLNAEQAPSPRYSAPKDGLPPVGKWTPSTVGSALNRPIYVGRPAWNLSRKRDSWGQLGCSPRPETEWVRAEREDLRIVPDQLWARVQARRRDVENRAVRFASGRLSGRPPKGEAKNLLAGMATCGVCGGGIIVEMGKYICCRRRQTAACSNTLRIRVEDLNECVLVSIEDHALTPEAVEAVVQLSERDDVGLRREQLDREADDIARKLTRLVGIIESGGDAASLVTRVRQLEAQQEAIRETLAGLRSVPRLAPRVVESRLAEWRRLLRASVTQGRAVLQRVIRGRITFTPLEDGTGYEFQAQTRFDQLFTGIAVPLVEAPEGIAADAGRGLERLDAQYSELLERAETLKGVRPWWDSNPRSPP